MTHEQIRRDSAVNVYISQADASMKALGFTEHSFAHVTRVAKSAETLGLAFRLHINGLQLV